MEDFIDTCIIISSFDNLDKYYEICRIFLEGSDKIIISFYQEKEEIPKFFFRKEKFFIEAMKFLKNHQYKIDYSIFTNKERILLRKLLSKLYLKQENEASLKKKYEEILKLKRNVFYFLEKKVYRKVVPITELNDDLINIIRKFNKNEADAKIITSAIQEHQENSLIAFTLDKKDWKLKKLQNKIKRKGYKCPEVRFLR